MEQLIKEAQNRNVDAFDQLMRVQMKRLYRIAITMLQNEDDAADAIQETTLKCWQKLSQLRNREYFETWLTKILMNECNNILRSRKRLVYVDEVPETIHKDDYSMFEWKDVLRSLDEKYRIVMELFYVDELSTKEIAGMLFITDAAVRTRLKRGRRQLEQLI